MEASKITFTDKTKAQLQNPLLKRSTKTKLRRELIKEYIRTKPAGTPLSTRELARVVGAQSTTGNFSTFLGRMVRDHQITMEKVPKSFKNIYTVCEDTTTVSPAIDRGAPSEPEESTPDARGGAGSVPQSTELDDLGMYYLYHYGQEADNVRSFIKWLKSRGVE